MKYILTLSSVIFLTQYTLIICKSDDLPDKSSPSIPNQLSSNATLNSTLEDNHESIKKLIHPSDQFGQTNSTNGSGVASEPPIIIHYVDFNLTENYNTSNEFYVVRNNNTDQLNDLNAVDSDNQTLIDQGKHMFNKLYNKMTHLVDYESMDTNILYNLWIPFISGFAVGLVLLIMMCCCRRCCGRCPGCRRVNKMNFKKKRGSNKLQSVDDNRYLLVSNHSDSEGV